MLATSATPLEGMPFIPKTAMVWIFAQMETSFPSGSPREWKVQQQTEAQRARDATVAAEYGENSDEYAGLRLFPWQL
jgi:hypothetical protein